MQQRHGMHHLLRLCCQLMDFWHERLNLSFDHLPIDFPPKWGKPYGKVMGWVRARLSFAILWATNRCVRGSRVMWRRGIGMEDLAAAMH